jgi:transcriptional regulator with XRE-family HTH domain
MVIRLSIAAGGPSSATGGTTARTWIRRSPRRATHIDLALAERIRARRVALGLTQQELAKRIGVSFQQAHKYETGGSRLSIGRLVAICQALRTVPSELLEGLTSVAGPELEALERDRMTLATDAALLLAGHQRVRVQFVRRLAEGQSCESALTARKSGS